MSASNWKTEEEARKCWCPQVRCEGSMSPPSNSVVRVRGDAVERPSWSLCCASECAMWVWSGEETWNADETDVLPLGGCGLRRLP